MLHNSHFPFFCINFPLFPPDNSFSFVLVENFHYLNVTDFSYWSCHVHLSFLAWSHTSCTWGSYCTTIVFSKKVPEPESAP